MTSYHSAVKFLFSRQAKGMKLGLDNVRNLLERIGNPQDQFTSVHVAGTNGKGSTAAILESTLRQAGYGSGLFTSPHLVDMRERILVRGEQISEQDVLDKTQMLYPHVVATGASFFEILTAMAFLHFVERGVDIAVLETGLGGRLDATNLVRPVLSIITEIGLDHMRILGPNLEAIAGEKAGILKPGVPCLCGAKRKAVQEHLSHWAEKKETSITFTSDRVKVFRVRQSESGTRFDCDTGGSGYRDLSLRLLGRHQVRNASLCLAAVDALRDAGWSISESAVRKGLEEVRWPARLDLLQNEPKILLDTAHNPMGMRMLAQTLRSIFTYRRLILVFGVLEDKDYRAMLATIAPLADCIIFTKPVSDRALEPEQLVHLEFVQNKHTEVIPDIQTAFDHAVSLAEKEDLVCCAGSMYFVGEILHLWETRKHACRKAG